MKNKLLLEKKNTKKDLATHFTRHKKANRKQKI